MLLKCRKEAMKRGFKMTYGQAITPGTQKLIGLYTDMIVKRCKYWHDTDGMMRI
jgi:hypothetical protein